MAWWRHAVATALCITFLVYLAFMEIVEGITVMVPLIAQARETHQGVRVEFGQLLAPADTVVAAVEAVGAKVKKASSAGITGSNMKLLNVHEMRVKFPKNVSYEVALGLSKRINALVLDTGSCQPGDIRTCVPLTETTKASFMRLQGLLEKTCRNSRVGVRATFHGCMLFQVFNNGFYLAAGSLTWEHSADCVYDMLDALPWSVDTKRLSKKLYLSYTLRCTKEHPLQVEHGFITQKRLEMHQHFPDRRAVELRCANDFSKKGKYNIFHRWRGAVEIGVFALTTWCKDKGYSAPECWDEATALMKPIEGKGTITMDAFSDPRIFALGLEVVERAYNGTLDFPEAFARYVRMSRALKKPLWSFRAVFGWGYDVESRIVGPTSFKTIEDAAHATGLLDPITYHNYRVECQDGDTGAVLFSVREHPGAERRQSYIYTVTPLQKLPNALAIIVQVICTVLASLCAGQSTLRHSVLGAASLVLTAGTWLFSTAVSSAYAGACELRLLALHGSPAQTLTLQTLERASLGSTTVVLVQAVIWSASHVGIVNTGYAPGDVRLALLLLGISVSFTVGLSCMASPVACAGQFPLRTLDVFGPMVLALLILPIVLRGHEKVKVGGKVKRILWRRFCYEEVSHGSLGLALGKRVLGRDFFFTVKPGPFIMRAGAGGKVSIVQDPMSQASPSPDSKLLKLVRRVLCERSYQRSSGYSNLVQECQQSPSAVDGCKEEAPRSITPDHNSTKDDRPPIAEGKVEAVKGIESDDEAILSFSHPSDPDLLVL